MLGLIAAIVAAPLLSAAPPQFVVPPNLPPATVGTKYTYSFCKPIAATRNGVCGSLKTPSANPNGGGGPPYIFSLRPGAGFPPNGVALSNRTGILTGTVKAGTAARVHRFTVCASSTRAEGVICRPTALRVNAAPTPRDAFAGTWKGTYKRTYALTGFCAGKTFVTEGAATFVIERSGTSYSVSYTFVDSFPDVTRCEIAARRDESYGFSAAAATSSTLTGSGWALTLQGATLSATWVSTDAGVTYRYDATLTRG